MVTEESRLFSRRTLNFALFVAAACTFIIGCGGQRQDDSPVGAFDNTGGTTSAGTKPTGAIGATCTGAEEASVSFSGYSSSEIVIDSTSNDCNGSACLMLHFAGRKSCPAGQTLSDLSAPAESSSRCFTPAGELVTVAVPAQEDPSSVDQHVFCSCRCDALAASPCVCPSDMVCAETAPLYTSPRGETFGGSYCVYSSNMP